MMATVLTAGDIAFVGFNFDDPDELAFVLLADIEAGTEIIFTDNGWLAAGGFRSGEGSFTWTAPSDLSAGTVVNPSLSGPLFATGGDQIIAYQGTAASPTFIAALNSEGSAVWQADATSSNTSALPTGLVNGETAVALTEIDNAIYTGATSGTRAELLAAINDPSNWSGSDSVRQTMPSLAFTVGAVSPVINEIVASHTGTDNTEFVEIFGAAGTSLAGLSLIAVESDAGTSPAPVPGTIDARFDFDASHVIGDNGFFLLGNPAGLLANYGVTPDAVIADNYLENSSATYALVETASLTGTSVTGSEVVIDTVALTDGGASDTFFFNAPVIGPDGSFFPAGARRLSDGVDTDTAADWAISDFNLGSANTPTAATVTEPPPPPDLTLISSIQGSGSASPMVGMTVTVEAIVVGDFQTSAALRGFYLQEEDTDADANVLTSEGIYVFDGNSPVDVQAGDLVRVTGTVGEFFGETQLANVTVEVLTAGQAGLATATQVDLPTLGTLTNSSGELIPDLEFVEGMLVSFSDTLTITELFNYDRFGEFQVSEGGQLRQFTQDNAPSVAGYAEHLADIASRTITIDDGRTAQNPDPILLPDGTAFMSDSVLRMGDTLDDVTGVVRFSRGSGGSGDETYRINLVEPATVTNVNVRPETPPEVGGSLQVASVNVLNFFATLENGTNTSGPSNLSPRGADNPIEYARQLEKLVEALVRMDADIYGLIEIENDFNPTSDGNAIAKLVDAMNAATAPGTYAWVYPGRDFVDVGDAISNGFIYKATTVELTQGAQVAILDDTVVDASTSLAGETIFDGDSTNRASLAASFTEKSSGETVVIAVNHFKSKGSLFGEPGNEDIGDGAGRNNLIRLEAAKALDEWLKTDPTNSGDSDVLILGDLNAYAKEDPIAYLEGEGFTNLEALFGPADGYSYVFDGQTGTLDYAMANGSLLSQVTGAAVWGVNSPEPDLIDYNTRFKPLSQQQTFDGDTPFRFSDHDPILVGLNLFSPNTAPLAYDDLAETDEDTSVTIDVLANDSDADGDTLTISAILTTPGNGDAVLNADGTITYTPSADFNGTDSFTYGITDGTDAATATVTVTVNPINDDPVAAGDMAKTNQNVAVVIDVLANDVDVDGDTLSVVTATDPANGTLAINGDGAITYTPDKGFFGADSFTYAIADGNGGSGVGTVDVVVNGRIFGGNGRDTLVGDVGDDTIRGENGADSLFGLEGDDSLDGGRGADLVDGGAGNDVLRGGNGDDILIGGVGNDTVFGGRGADVFVLALGDGTDTFRDFDVEDDLLGLTGGLTFGDLSFVQNADDTEIFAGLEKLAILKGVSVGDAGDIAFVDSFVIA